MKRQLPTKRRRLLPIGLILVLAASSDLRAQLDSEWIIKVGSETVRANPDGSFFIGNVTADDQFGRSGPGSQSDFVSDDFLFVTAVRTEGERTVYAFSEPSKIRDGETYFVNRMVERDEPPRFAERLELSISERTIGVGETTQLRVIATFVDGDEKDVTSREDFTIYRTSNPAIATVDENGLVTGHPNGTAFVTATNTGATSVGLLRVEAGITRTTVEGFLRLPDGTPAAGVEVMTTLGGSVVTDEEGDFSLILEDVTITGDFKLLASLEVGEETLVLNSPTFTVEAETDLVDVGILNLVPKAPSAFFVNPIYHYMESFDDPFLFPGEVMLEDLDGDADLDAAVVFNSGDQVRIYLNDGDGTLAEDGRYPVGQNPWEADAGDIDADGDVDLLVPGRDTQLAILLNNGAGTFGELADLPTGGENPNSFSVGDLDGAGDMDILIANGQTFEVDVVLFDSDDGSYNELESVPMGSFNRPYDVEVADLDGDGVLDIIVAIIGPRLNAQIPDKLGVAMGLGSGLFDQVALAEVGEGVEHLEVDDLNGDGRPDVVLGAERSGLLVFLNDGTGALLEPATYVFESRLEDEDLVVNQDLQDITVADLDVDGDLDIVLTAEDRLDREECVAVLFNDGEGAFPERRGIDLDQAIVFLDSGDVDADGDPNLLVGGCAIHVVFNDGITADDRASLPEVTSVDIEGSRGPRSFAVADFDDDGDPDVAFVGFTDTTGLYKSGRMGGMASSPRLSHSTSTSTATAPVRLRSSLMIPTATPTLPSAIMAIPGALRFG